MLAEYYSIRWGMDTKYIDLSSRSRRILRAVVEQYIEEAHPVGSRTVAELSGLGLSPATIRNVMADLEEQDLLFQPHTSAGRLPTETGLRYYVGCLLEKEFLPGNIQAAIEEKLLSNRSDLVSTMRRAVHLLASFSGHAAVVKTPRFLVSNLQHLEFLKIRPGLILVIGVSRNGLVQNRFIQLDQDVSRARLEGLSRKVNEGLVVMSFDELRERMLRELDEEKKIVNLFLEDVLDSEDILEEQENVLVDGHINLLTHTRAANFSMIKKLIQALEEKKTLLSLLEKCQESSGLQIVIGSEGLETDIPACGMVMAPYEGPEYPLGSLGVVGPLHMNYGRAAALVEYTAQVLSERFKER